MMNRLKAWPGFVRAVAVVITAMIMAASAPVVPTLIVSEMIAEDIDWESIAESPEFKQLELIRDRVVTQLASQDVSQGELRLAYTSNDIDVVAATLGLTSQEVAEMTNLFREAMDSLHGEYPEFNPNNDALFGKCTPSDIGYVLDNYTASMANYAALSGMNTEALADVGCAWIPYTGCLVAAGVIANAAAVLGPAIIIGYGAAAIYCLCEHCEGGWISWMCNWGLG